MKSVPVSYFKAEFSDILQQVKEHGESFIIEYGRNNKKVAVLIPYNESLESDEPRRFGIMKNRGSCLLNIDFQMTDNELLKRE